MTDATPQPDSSTTDPRVTSAMEDYLKAAYHLETQGGPITTQRMAEELGLSQPSVTNMVKRLDDLNLVVHSPYRGITLTESGRRVALEVIRHHRLLELYLSEALGFDLEQVHAEAERLEHHISEELEERMERALGYPEFDPHGDPIPRRDGGLMNDTSLTDLPVGSNGQISRVSDRDPARLAYLTERGIRPGVRLTVREQMPFEGPVRVELDGMEHLLPHSVAILVRVDLDQTAPTP
jgi:DtxR family Mn-dependent transcriptional regulator